MTAAVKTKLESYDELPEGEKREVASAILRRTLRFDLPPHRRSSWCAVARSTQIPRFDPRLIFTSGTAPLGSRSRTI